MTKSYGDEVAEKLAEKAKKEKGKRRKHNQKRKAEKRYKANFKQEETRIIELMKESADHDHSKCKCEGCYWWTMTNTIMQNGRFYYVEPSWKDIDVNEFLRVNQAYQRFKLDKQMPLEKLVEYLIGEGAPKEKAEEIAKNMLSPLFTIMVGKAPSPMGLLRDI